MSKMRFQTQINTTDPSEWQQVKADTFQDAAIEALRHSTPMPSLPCIVYVGDPRPTLQHDNGTPIVVHAFTIARSDAG